VPAELLDSEFEVVGYWYNPNIHPYAEYQKRLQAAGYVFSRIHKPVEWDLEYDIRMWFEKVMEAEKSGQKRCQACYSVRLGRTAETARKMGIGVFSTTLLQSEHQDISLIIEAGECAGRFYGVRFIPRRFKDAHMEGRRRSIEWQVYRQNYCGCIFSEIERRGLGGANLQKK
jgi:predicted adenine nucleotide alpha hydrolase (AANH) superfamily ATPase